MTLVIRIYSMNEQKLWIAIQYLEMFVSIHADHARAEVHLTGLLLTSSIMAQCQYEVTNSTYVNNFVISMVDSIQSQNIATVSLYSYFKPHHVIK